MLCSEVLKEAAMIVVTTHTFLSCIYLFKVRITTKEKLPYKAFKFLSCKKKHFCKKILATWLLVARVYLGWH